MTHNDVQLIHNDVQLNRSILFDLLDDLQQRTWQAFGSQIRLFIHGGAVMILHPLLSSSSTRRTTRDVDYIRRAFGHEWRKKGVYDAEERLQSCINATAQRFLLGSDWMNADPDVALPFARDPQGSLYDPIYYDAKQPNNVEMNTVYSSPGLLLISVTMFWGVALKLVRYQKEDPTDIVAMLRHGTKLNGVQWTPQIMEDWIKTLCWPMGYDAYQPQRIDELRERIQHAVRLLQCFPDNDRNYPSMHARRPSMHAVQLRTHSSGSSSSSSSGSISHIHTHTHTHTQSHVQSQPHPQWWTPHLSVHASPQDQPLVLHRTASHVTSPFSSPSDSVPIISMPEPWQHHGPVVPHTRAF